MPRRGKVVKRVTAQDARYHSQLVTRLTNKIMLSGKKSTATRLMYGAMDLVQSQTRREPLEVLEQAIRNATPALEVKPRRVGGATYQVPVEIRGERKMSLAIRWLITAARNRSGRTFAEKLAAEIMDASNNQGVTVKRREDTHRMAEANKAFVHYRW
ncbi:MAG: 30S ribosomal protein S7 [Dehalococcoidia bacterium]|nr:30S ribosomal protein S7 [Dehalococcoidia bacterium]